MGSSFFLFLRSDQQMLCPLSANDDLISRCGRGGVRVAWGQDLSIDRATEDSFLVDEGVSRVLHNLLHDSRRLACDAMFLECCDLVMW